ncbi:MAG TPA: hypothetical protein VFJ30_02690 [Phycisphaerae bacterium]|nr:hypothetical protein [Phycisphaerae bacterium]
MKLMEHIREVDPHEAWKQGIAYVLRIRSILICFGTDVVLTVLAHFLLGWQVAALVLGVGVLAVLTLSLFRRVRIRDLYLGVRLHNLLHSLRDQAQEVIAPLEQEGNSPTAMIQYRERYSHIHDSWTELIAAYFRCLLGDQTVNCAVRLADIRDGERVYVTWGRSRNMDPNRSDRSVPVPSEGSIASALMRHDERGVYLIPNVREVSEEDKKDKWADDPNTQLRDVTALMVAPINAYDEGSKVMLGLLYITSRRKVVSCMCVEPLKAVADILGFVYPKITFGENQEGTDDGQEGRDSAAAIQ